MSVETAHKDYGRREDQWQLIRDVIEGHDCIKGMRDCKVDSDKACKYLPIPCGMSDDPEEYCAYVFRAKWLAATQRTLEGLVGLVFERPIKCEIPEKMNYLKENADGTGVSLEGHAKSTLREVASLGHYGLLTDFPSAEGALSREQEIQLGSRPKICAYPAECIINWRVRRMGADQILDWLVLRECEECCNPEDKFETVLRDQYRHLYLDEEGFLVSCLYTCDSDGDFIAGFPERPKKADGSFWNRIPFHFVGAESNRPCADSPPMLNLAQMNLGHYRNSADLENSVFFVGQPTVWINGFDEAALEAAREHKLTYKFGSRVFLKLPPDAKAGMLQMADNGGAFRLMEQCRLDMVAMGANFLRSEKLGVEAADALRIREGSDQSAIKTWTDNVTDAYQKCLIDIAEWLSIPSEGISFHLNRDFLEHSLTSSQILDVANAWLSGGISLETYSDLMRRGGAIDKRKDNDTIIEELETRAPNVIFEESDLNGRDAQ